MPSRIYSRFPERKITQASPAALPKPGSQGTVNERTASWPSLPGKAQKSRLTGPKIKHYASSQGI
jgi:hypothetical protein